MLKGPLWGPLLMFALPVAASSVLQQLFNTVDIAVLGRWASSNALAAVGTNAPVIGLLINMFVGLSIGANVVIANYIGSRNQDGVRRGVATAWTVALLSGAALLVAGWWLAPVILTAMDTPPEILGMACLYLRIYLLGAPLFMAFNFGAAILRSMGNTRTPLVILAVAGVVNTAFNLWFVLGLGWGVEGVAVATTIANGVSAGMMAWVLRRLPGPYRVDLLRLRCHRPELVKMLRIGVPAGIQGMVFSVSNVLIQGVINGFGAVAVAGSATGQNFEYYVYYFISAFGTGATTFIGQNYGAGNLRRCRGVYLRCMAYAVASCVALSWGFYLWRGQLVGLFTTDGAVAAYAYERMRWVLMFQWVACSYEISASALRGLDRSLTPALLIIAGTCVLRVAWVFAWIPSHHSFATLMAVYPLSWVITGALVVGAYVLHARALRRAAVPKPL